MELNKLQLGKYNKEDEFYFHSNCHPSSATWIRCKDGVYELICAKCEKIIASNMVIEWGDEINFN